MAGVFHISEAEAARDFAAVMRRVRAGDEVVVEDAEGGALAVMRSPAAAGGDASTGARMRGKTAAEVIAGFRQWEAENGPLGMGEDFARDGEEGRRANGPGGRPAARTVDQARALLQGRAEGGYSADDDPEFGADMEAVRAIYNAPLDDSKWA